MVIQARAWMPHYQTGHDVPLASVQAAAAAAFSALLPRLATWRSLINSLIYFAFFANHVLANALVSHIV